LGFSATAFELPSGTSLSTVALAGTVGFLSFAGFESSASLGEEATEPTRMIPRSLVISVAVGAVFYIVCMSAQSLGFGTHPAGVKAFTASGAPLGDLAHTYVGSAMAALLDLGAVLRAPRREIVLPLGGLAIVGYTLYRNLHPAPPSPFDVFPYVVAAWILVGVVLAIARRRRPGLG